MTNYRLINFALNLSLLPILPALLSAQVKTSATKQLSLSTSGGAPAGLSGSPAIAINGKMIAFVSSAEDLVLDDSNKRRDIFARNLETGTVSRLSVNNAGSQANEDSYEPAVSPITPEGLFAVSFTSDAFSLGSIGVPNSARTVYLRVPALNLTEVISFAPGALAANGDSDSSSITLLPNPTRALIAYTSNASNLVADHFNSFNDIYLATVALPASSGGFADLELLDAAVSTTLVTKGIGSQGANGDSFNARMSGDGRFIVFASQASNLISGVSIAGQQIYRYTIATGATELISKSIGDSAADGECSKPSVSFSGRFVTYLSKATNLVPGGAVNKDSVIFHDLAKNTVLRVNTSSEGIASNGNASSPAVSANGRFISFSDDGTNLVTSDSNGVSDVFLKDLDSRTTVRASIGLGSEANSSSDTSIIAGASYNSLTSSLFFRSLATNLTSPSTTSGAGDIFNLEATLPAPQLSKGSKIETPADVTIKGKRSVISAQKFSFPKTTLALVIAPPTTLSASIQKKTVNYEFHVEGTGNRKKVRQKLLGRRNTVTTSKLKPGIYNTRYRVTATQGTKVVSKTPFSPRQQFEIK